MQVYFAAKDISIRDAARLLVNYHEDKAIEWNDPEIRRLMLNARTALEGEQIGFDETLFAMLLQRVRNHHSLEELIAELRENSGLREIFTTGLVTTPTLANLMINGAWLGEEGKDRPCLGGCAYGTAGSGGVCDRVQHPTGLRSCRSCDSCHSRRVP